MLNQKRTIPTQVFLVDNGSLRPEAIRGLRRIALRLGRRLERKVGPVSMLHSNAVPAAKLGGRKAETLELALRRRAMKGARDFVIIPLYLGRSASLVKYVPSLARRLRAEFPRLRVRVAEPLGANRGRDLRTILRDLSVAKLTRKFLRGERPNVVLVDHGSPSRSVTWTRNQLWGQLRGAIDSRVDRMKASSMERRPGRKYDFNEPLLEDVLQQAPFTSGPVLVVQLFILPGRHAGLDGDIARICERAEAKHPRLRTSRTELLGTHPRLIEVLAKRFREVTRERRVHRVTFD